jgi:transcriptional regulator with XRE-family HTH domain
MAVSKIKPNKNGDTFGERAMAKIVSLGLTQMDVAQRLGVTQTQISRLINGGHQPGFGQIMLWAIALECSPHDLIPAVVPQSYQEQLSQRLDQI